MAGKLEGVPRPFTPTTKQRQLASILGRGIAVAAFSRQQLSPALLDGLNTLRLALDRKGTRSPIWEEVLTTNLDAAAIRQLLDSNGPTSPCFAFLAACKKALETPLGGPEELDRTGDVDRVTPGVPGSAQASSLPPQGDREGHGDLKASPNSPGEELLPSIGARLWAAEMASFGEKLGFHSHDLLIPEDLKVVTTAAAKDLRGSDCLTQTQALFAICSLITGCTDVQALELKFEPGEDMWLDLAAGSFCWNFTAYRKIGEPPLDSNQPITIFLPKDVADLLRQIDGRNPSAKNLRALLELRLGASLDLKKFREYLRSCGCSAHPAYRGRFARSLPLVYLLITGSDMTAALATSHFTVAAPAALYYFGPRMATLHWRTSQVYKYLNLDQPCDPPEPARRLGCQKVLERPALAAGWGSLVASINDQLSQLRTCSLDLRAPLGNRLMASLCAAFIVQTAHRGSRLECLTFGALLLHPACMLILDKDEGERPPTRMVGKTSAVQQVLDAAVECLTLVEGGGRACLEADDPMFIQWNTSSTGSTHDTDCIAPPAVNSILVQHFPCFSINFARSAWVTYLDEAGCDRWLIRTLTGHTRDVTRVNGAYFDKPPLVAAAALATEMERIAPEMFGIQQIAAEKASIPVRFRTRLGSETSTPGSNMVADPRTLLEPLDVEALACWRATNVVVQALVGGRIQAPASVLAALSLIFVDCYPDAELVLSVVRSGKVKHWGDMPGVYWDRPHFTHATFLPMQHLTERLLTLAQTEPRAPDKLRKAVAASLQRIDPQFWPRNPDSCWGTVLATARRYRRLELPPSLLAVSLPTTPSPTLSELSLMRLANERVPAQHLPAGPALQTRKNRKEVSVDLTQLRHLVARHTGSTRKSDGELRARALECQQAIKSNFRPNDYFARWVGDWLQDELPRSAALERDRLDISSLYQYLSIISTLVVDASDEDPYEWESDDWHRWLDGLAKSYPPADNDSSDQLSKAIQDAVGRLIRNLHARGDDVPSDVAQRVFRRTSAIHAHGSASSSVILPEDIRVATKMASNWLKESPFDRVLVLTRAVIHAAVGPRTREISSLATDCLTPGGALVIERAGFKVHKTANAIRTILVSAALQNKLKRLRDVISRFRQERDPLLLRGSGTHEESVRDVRIDMVWSHALKLATGDPAARRHSVRAMVFQEGTWPGWSYLAQRVMRGQASMRECALWVEDLQSEWNRMAFSSAQAGHGDLRAGIGGYLAGWALVAHFHHTRLLSRTKPQPKLVERLGFNSNSFVKARSRGESLYGAWLWTVETIRSARVRDDVPASAKDISSGPTLVQPSNISSSTHAAVALQRKRNIDQIEHSSAPARMSLVELTYLTARLIGMEKAHALERACIQLSVSSRLEQIEVPLELRAKAVQRARSAPNQGAIKATLKLLFEEDKHGRRVGEGILRWVGSFTGRHRLTLLNCVFKINAPETTGSTFEDLWRATVKEIPEFLRLRVHRAPSYLTPAERCAFDELPGAMTLVEDLNIGRMPKISVWPRISENQVVATRYSSIFRAALLAGRAIDGGGRND